MFIMLCGSEEKARILVTMMNNLGYKMYNLGNHLFSEKYVNEDAEEGKIFYFHLYECMAQQLNKDQSVVSSL
jgi:hypothetical protein